MKYEVEQKFAAADLQGLIGRLAALGGVLGEPDVEVDRYYAHPARDFARTDEALRIRTTAAGCWITYKGPKIDASTKTRRELDLPLGSDQAPHWAELLEALGFRPVADVRKRRRRGSVAWEGRRIEVCLDDVEQVGTFVELEIVADEADVDAARACLASLARRLELSGSERRSYLELLLGARLQSGA